MKKLITQEFVSNAKKAGNILSAINATNRSSKVLNYLYESGLKLTVTDLYVKFRCEQPVMSAILARLKKVNLVIVAKDGKYRRYFANRKQVQHVFSFCTKIAEL